jgi:hypothetical protein
MMSLNDHVNLLKEAKDLALAGEYVAAFKKILVGLGDAADVATDQGFRGVSTTDGFQENKLQELSVVCDDFNRAVAACKTKVEAGPDGMKKIGDGKILEALGKLAEIVGPILLKIFLKV